MTGEHFIPAVPSQRQMVLRGLLGQCVAKIEHFSHSSTQEISDYHEIQKTDVFSFADGPFVISVASGLAVGFGTLDSLNSITVWTEQTEAGEKYGDCAEGDDGMAPVDATDEIFADRFWGRIVGQAVVRVTVFRRHMTDPRYEDLPNEAAVAVMVGDGSSFILGHNLLDVSEDFLALEIERLPPAVARQLTKICVLEVPPTEGTSI